MGYSLRTLLINESLARLLLPIMIDLSFYCCFITYISSTSTLKCSPLVSFILKLTAAPINANPQKIIMMKLVFMRSKIKGLRIEANEPKAETVPTPRPVTVVGYSSLMYSSKTQK